MKQQQEQKTEQRNFIENSKFLEMIDIEVKKFINNPSNHFIIEKAKKKKLLWLASLKKRLSRIVRLFKNEFCNAN
jgi:hypothetical protein